MSILRKITLYTTVLLTSGFIDFIQPKNVFSTNINNLDIDYLNWNKKDDHILGSGDKINIVISEEDPLLNINAIIDNNGTIVLPEIDRVFVSGLTKAELKELLTLKYKNILRKTDIKISILRSRDIQVFLKGEVVNPGIYTFNTSIPIQNQFYPNKEDNINTTPLDVYSVFPNSDPIPKTYDFRPKLFDAIKRAGGITRNTDLRNIEVVRENTISNGGGKIKTNLDLLAILKNGDSSQNINLKDGDLITLKRSANEISIQIKEIMSSNINSKYINVYITGRVKSPGPFTMLRNSDLNSAIFLAGGTRFLKGTVFLLRYELNGELNKKPIRYSRKAPSGSRNNPYLYEGDIIHVGETPFTIAGEVINEITRPFVGIYSTINLFND